MKEIYAFHCFPNRLIILRRQESNVALNTFHQLKTSFNNFPYPIYYVSNNMIFRAISTRPCVFRNDVPVII